MLVKGNLLKLNYVYKILTTQMQLRMVQLNDRTTASLLEIPWLN